MEDSKKLLNSKSRHGLISMAVAIVLGFFGVAAIAYGLYSYNQDNNFTSLSSDEQTDQKSTESTEFLPYSEPVSISIPSIGVESEIIEVGKKEDGTLEVPEGNDFHKAAWYRNSPTPGQFGASIIEGHYDSEEDGPSVFFRLGELKLGDKVRIKRKDGRTATFIVKGRDKFKKDTFPSMLVYHPDDHPTLNLITCGGVFNRSTGHYESNIVVFTAMDKEE